MEIEFDRVLWAQFVYGNNVLFDFLNFNLALNVTLEWTDEKTVWALINFSDFNIFGSCEIFPFFCMFDIQLLWNVAYWSWSGLLFWLTVVILTILEVDILEGLLSIELEDKIWVFVFNNTLIIGEDHGWGSEEVTLISNFVNEGRWWKASLFELESPVFAVVWYLLDHGYCCYWLDILCFVYWLF